MAAKGANETNRTLPAAFYRLLPGKKRSFLLAYAACGSMRKAAAEVGIKHPHHYYWLETDPVYAEVWPIAKEMAADSIEEEVTRRALGWEEERYTDDGIRYTIQKYSDTLLIFRLKALRPEMYRDNAKPDSRTEVSDLLKAVLLELVERREGRNVTPEAEWAPLPPATRPVNGQSALPAPPSADEED